MFKKSNFIYLLIFGLFLIFPFSKVSAINMEDGTELSSNYDIFNYLLSYNDTDFKKCFLIKESYSTTTNSVTSYFIDYSLYCSSSEMSALTNRNLYSIYFQDYSRITITNNIEEDYYSFYQYGKKYMSGYGAVVNNVSFIIMSNYDIYLEDTDTILFNFNYYELLNYRLNFTSNVDDYNLILKDSDNNVINVNEDNSYTLIESNTYTYVATKEDYKNVEGSITISENTTINLNFEVIIDKISINSIFSSFTSTYINFLSIIYDNVIFLFLVSIILIFSIILLIKKLF